MSAVDSPLPGFRLEYGVLSAANLLVPLNVVGDAKTEMSHWPRVAKVVGDAVLTDLPRMKWEREDRGVVSGVEGVIAAMGIAHALGSRHHQCAVTMNGEVVADPATVYGFIASGLRLRPVSEVRPGRPVPLPNNKHVAKYVEYYRAAGTLFARSLAHPALALGTTTKPMIITFELLRAATRFSLAKVAWLAGFFYPEHPLVAEVEIGASKAYFVVAEHGSFTTGRVAGRVDAERMYQLQ